MMRMCLLVPIHQNPSSSCLSKIKLSPETRVGDGDLDFGDDDDDDLGRVND